MLIWRGEIEKDQEFGYNWWEIWGWNEGWNFAVMCVKQEALLGRVGSMSILVGRILESRGICQSGLCPQAPDHLGSRGSPRSHSRQGSNETAWLGGSFLSLFLLSSGVPSCLHFEVQSHTEFKLHGIEWRSIILLPLLFLSTLP